MLIDFYPDCQSKEMSDSDPRFKFMEKDEINSLPIFAFTTGYKPLFQVARPDIQLIPNYYYSKTIYI